MSDDWIIRTKPKRNKIALWQETSYPDFLSFLSALHSAKAAMDRLDVEVVEAENSGPLERQTVKDLGFDLILFR